MFCASRLVFGDIEGVGSLFQVLRAQTHFRRYRVRRVNFYVLRAHTHFRQYQERQFPFSTFARPNSFLAVPRAPGLIFMFCAPGLVFGGTEGAGYRFHVLRAWTRFRQYQGRRVPF
jgi:hypothetical protein